jgi:RNA recognition motif-containing protein
LLILIENMKSKVLYVRGLANENITVKMLYNIFSNFGNVTKIMMNKEKLSSLVEYQNLEFAAIAKDYLNNMVFFSKYLRVDIFSFSFNLD